MFVCLFVCLFVRLLVVATLGFHADTDGVDPLLNIDHPTLTDGRWTQTNSDMNSGLISLDELQEEAEERKEGDWLTAFVNETSRRRMK